eukprot:364403-Chlamydomonas_euryale.AAC.9
MRGAAPGVPHTGCAPLPHPFLTPHARRPPYTCQVVVGADCVAANSDSARSTHPLHTHAPHLRHTRQVDAVVVGADRVAANGDSANKIGTYALSIAARHHGVPFFIAAPSTTLDPHMPHGGSIVIEQRPADEITHFRGNRVVKEGVQVWEHSCPPTPLSLLPHSFPSIFSRPSTFKA